MPPAIWEEQRRIDYGHDVGAGLHSRSMNADWRPAPPFEMNKTGYGMRGFEITGPDGILIYLGEGTAP